MPSVRTKPVRILEADHGVLRLLANLEGRAPAQVLHSALIEYFEQHRDEIATIFADAQAAIAAGDLRALTQQFARSADTLADEHAARLAELR